MRMTFGAIILGTTMVVSMLLPARGQVAGEAFESVPGHEERAETDFSALQKDVRVRLQQLDGKYGSPAWWNMGNADLIPVAEMGNSKVVRDDLVNLLYWQNRLKGVFFRDEKGDGYDEVPPFSGPFAVRVMA